MTKKDYIKIAALLADHIRRANDAIPQLIDELDLPVDGYIVEDHNQDVFIDTVAGFCKMLKQDNASFNVETFVIAVFDGDCPAGIIERVQKSIL